MKKNSRRKEFNQANQAKGKQVSITLGYSDTGERIRTVEKVYSKAEEKKILDLYSDPVVKEKALIMKLIKKGYIQAEEKENVNTNICEYMLKAVGQICDNRMKAGNMTEGTKAGHLSDTRYVKNYFAGDKNIAIDKVTVKDIQAFMDDFAVNHCKSTMKKAVRMLKWTFQEALEDRLIKDDIMQSKRIIIPYGLCKDADRGEEVVIEFYTDNELMELRRAFGDNILISTFTNVLEKTGVRISEALALKLDDIDEYNNRLRIDEAFKVCSAEKDTDEDDVDIDKMKRSAVIGATKSGNIRKIDMSTSLKESLKKYIEITNEKEAIRRKREETGLIFITPEGEICTRYGMRSRVDTILKKAKSKIKFGFHKYRHTFGTKLAEDGVNDSLLQYYMGHSDISVTRKFYIGVTRKMREEGRKVIESWR